LTIYPDNSYQLEIVFLPLLLAYSMLPFIAAAQTNLCPFLNVHSFNLNDFNTLSPFHQPRSHLM